MATQNDNPFVLPGFGHSGDMAENPLVASMEMMRQAWQGLAGASRFDQAAMGGPLSPGELDRRIADLKAVENWLRMNLSMLSSTIQALEVQRAMVATLKSFVSGAAPQSSDGRSPLEVVLGIHPGAGRGEGAAAKPSEPAGAAAGHQTATPAADGAQDRAAAPAQSHKDAAADQADQGSGGMPDAYAAQAAAAAQGWWDMVQKQFDTLATATAATMQAADAVKSPAGPGSAGVSGDSRLGKAQGGDTASGPRRKAAPGGTPRKTAKKASAPARRSSSSAKKA